jgi:adenylate cyclase
LRSFGCSQQRFVEVFHLLTLSPPFVSLLIMTRGSTKDAYAESEEWRQVLTSGHLGQNWLRRTLRNLPSAPRCKVCNNPFGGIGGSVCGFFGLSPSKKNPNICALCCEKMPRGGAEVDAAILFADVRNSTAIAERLGPTRYSEALNRFYSVAADVLIRRDAVVDKLIGDEVMAFFVSGHAGRDFKRKAVETGKELLKATGQFDANGPELPIGIGIESGIAFAGNIGPDNVVDFTVVGDPVNLAARIQGVAGAGELLVGANLFDAVRDRYGDCSSRMVEVRGKRQPVRVFSIPADLGGA